VAKNKDDQKGNHMHGIPTPTAREKQIERLQQAARNLADPSGEIRQCLEDLKRRLEEKETKIFFRLLEEEGWPDENA